MSKFRTQVLSAFKELHKARLQTFKGDEKALSEGRELINEHFKKNSLETDAQKIEQHIVDARDAAKVVREHIIQIEKVDDTKFRANITKDTYKLDNTEFRDITEEELLAASKKRKRGKARKCGEVEDKNKN